MSNKAAQQLGRLGGKSTSETKSTAARKNGASGGRIPALSGDHPVVKTIAGQELGMWEAVRQGAIKGAESKAAIYLAPCLMNADERRWFAGEMTAAGFEVARRSKMNDGSVMPVVWKRSK